MDLLGRFATFMDRPGFDWKALVIGFSVGHYVFRTYVDYRQYKVLQRTKVPPSMKEILTQESFDKTQDYSRAHARFDFVSGFVDLVSNVAILKFDVLPKMFDWSGRFLAGVGAPAWFAGVGPQSIVAFFALGLVSTLFKLPFSLYRTFVIEEKYGFNKQTLGLYFTDMIKSELLSMTIGTPIIMGMLKIIDYFGDKFYYYLWGFFMVVQVLMIAIFPTIIQPLFNKFTPLEEGELRTSIFNLADRVKFPLDKLFVIDGSKRSNHSNAYFFGLPWSKRIVIYDTLINQATVNEVTAVLAHEIGHWSLNHILKSMIVSQFQLLTIFVLFTGFVHNKSMFDSFGFHTTMPVLTGFVLFYDILEPINALLGIGNNVMVRTNEYQADAYAHKLGYSKDLGKALTGLHEKNLGTIEADWLYSAVNLSHPTLPERLQALEQLDKKEK